MTKDFYSSSGVLQKIINLFHLLKYTDTNSFQNKGDKQLNVEILENYEK